MRDAIRNLEGKEFDLVVTDIRMPDGTGMEVMQSARQLSPGTAVILLTAATTTSARHTSNWVTASDGGASSPENSSSGGSAPSRLPNGPCICGERSSALPTSDAIRKRCAWAARSCEAVEPT